MNNGIKTTKNFILENANHIEAITFVTKLITEVMEYQKIKEIETTKRQIAKIEYEEQKQKIDIFFKLADQISKKKLDMLEGTLNKLNEILDYTYKKEDTKNLLGVLETIVSLFKVDIFGNDFESISTAFANLKPGQKVKVEL